MDWVVSLKTLPVIVVLSLIWSSNDKVNAQDDGIKLSAELYIHVDNPKTWYDAKLHCESKDWAMLARTATQQIYIDIANGALALANAGYNLEYVYIGLSDIEQDGEFRYTGGGISPFNFWGPNQPNNVIGQEDCVVISAATSMMETIPCSSNQAFACYHPTGSVWYIANNLLYRFAPYWFTWYEAWDYCDWKAGGDVISFNDATLYSNLMQQHQSSTSYTDRDFWYDGFEHPNDGVWLHKEYTVLDFVNWGPGQPDNPAGGDCVLVDRSSQHSRWNDEDCYTLAAIFCQHEIPPLEFEFVDIAMTWHDANQHCSDLGRHLARVRHDVEHVAAMISLVEVGFDINAEQMWVDGNDIDNEGDFLLSNGWPLQYLSWSANRPNTEPDNEDDCLLLRSDGYKIGYGDANCMETHTFFCQTGDEQYYTHGPTTVTMSTSTPSTEQISTKPTTGATDVAQVTFITSIPTTNSNTQTSSSVTMAATDMQIDQTTISAGITDSNGFDITPIIIGTLAGLLALASIPLFLLARKKWKKKKENAIAPSEETPVKQSPEERAVTTPT